MAIFLGFTARNCSRSIFPGSVKMLIIKGFEKHKEKSKITLNYVSAKRHQNVVNFIVDIYLFEILNAFLKLPFLKTGRISTEFNLIQTGICFRPSGPGSAGSSGSRKPPYLIREYKSYSN